MQQALVWRLEGSDGLGPYRTGSWDNVPNQDACSLSIYYGSSNPSPCEEGLGRIENNDRFGFASLSCARNWWFSPEDLEAWARYGFVLVAYRQSDCLNIRRGPRQCVFQLEPHAKSAKFPCDALHTVADDELQVQALVQINNRPM